MEKSLKSKQFEAPRIFDRQDVINGIVKVRDIGAGAVLNETGLDFDIADGLNQLGYMLVKTNELDKDEGQ